MADAIVHHVDTHRLEVTVVPLISRRLAWTLRGPS